MISNNLEDFVQKHLAGSGSPLSGLLNMIPIIGPLISGFLGGGLRSPKRHSGQRSAWNDFLKEHKAQHPSARHGDIMRMLGEKYRSGRS